MACGALPALTPSRVTDSSTWLGRPNVRLGLTNVPVDGGPPMNRVLAAGTSFGIEEYEVEPHAFSALLQRAKTEHGHALCLCTTPNPQLVIRRVRGERGDRFLLASWPKKGAGHAPGCRFHHSEEDYEKARAKRLAAVQHSDDGFAIKPEFSLRRMNAAPEPPESRREPEGGGAPHAQRDSLSLLATLEFLWHEAGLHQFIPGSARRWAQIAQRLDTVLAQGRLGGQLLSQLCWLVPPYELDSQAEVAQRFEAMIARFRRTEDMTPSFLVLGEVKEVTAVTPRSIRTMLRHQARPVWMFNSLGRALAQRHPIAESQLRAAAQQQQITGRVVGLYLVELSDKGHLWARDAALLTCSREYLPCDSSYEVDLANRMSEAGRRFDKPMRIDLQEDLLPDFELLDTTPPRPMEVWGRDDQEYNEHKAVKRERYRARGAALWEWEAWRDALPPPLPALPSARPVS
jgi:hypothetical protein